jgi:hypothetical protein
MVCANRCNIKKKVTVMQTASEAKQMDWSEVNERYWQSRTTVITTGGQGALGLAPRTFRKVVLDLDVLLGSH